ncbi:hypothetical protein H7J86_03485 [Mycobacterium hackensackense]|uniref:hypothetical protein n=1 Tax=Mycobacterium hackensackense TaxID=228909 RepID=UPI002265C307|nr:hypothetical protein [Mycobacterium hackensackense]MCV7251214.1 hypothetical protein [Mycobacterium hackensackense]
MGKTSPKPRVTFICPKCKQRIAWILTPAQLRVKDALTANPEDETVPPPPWPVLFHRIAEPEPLAPRKTAALSRRLKGQRSKGFHGSYLAQNADDIVVLCHAACGAKFSVPTNGLLAAMADGHRPRQLLPTRRAL